MLLLVPIVAKFHHREAARLGPRFRAIVVVERALLVRVMLLLLVLVLVLVLRVRQMMRRLRMRVSRQLLVRMQRPIGTRERPLPRVKAMRRRRRRRRAVVVLPPLLVCIWRLEVERRVLPLAPGRRRGGSGRR